MEKDRNRLCRWRRTATGSAGNTPSGQIDRHDAVKSNIFYSPDSYHVVQPSQPTREITRSRSHHTLTDTTVVYTAVFHTAPAPSSAHLRNETFYFDTVEEAGEFRDFVAALTLRNHPELCIPPMSVLF